MPHGPAPLFDRRRLALHRARAACVPLSASFLHARVAEDLAERLEAVNRAFGTSVALGGGRFLAPAIAARPALAARIGPLFSLDVTPVGLEAGTGVAGDPEASPLAPGAFGLIASALLLHWANDLPGALIQARAALRPDGLFLGALFGARTLHELRTALLAAETETSGGAALRVAPFTELGDGAALLQRAGFALPVADCDVVTVRYRDVFALLRDLRAMGETSALTEPGPPLKRAVLLRLGEIYRERFAGADGRIPATFEIVTLTGWAPHESQQRPLRPGAAQTRLAAALGVEEGVLPR